MDRELAQEIIAKYAAASRVYGPCDRARAESAVAALYQTFGFEVPRFEWFESPLPAVRLIANTNSRRSAVRSVSKRQWQEFEAFCLYFVGLPSEFDGDHYLLAPEEISEWHNLVHGVLRHHVSEVPDFAHGSTSAVDACLMELRRSPHKHLDLFCETVWHCGWWRPTPSVCYMVDRPIELQLDERGRIHRRVLYADGFVVHAIHGVAVPEYIATGEYAADDIDRMQNVEVRRVMLQDYGLERYLRETRAEEIARDEVGVLYRKPQDNDEPLVVVKVRNSTAEPDGTYKDYFLRVPPQVTTPREAIAWTFEMQSEQYSPKKET